MRDNAIRRYNEIISKVNLDFKEPPNKNITENFVLFFRIIFRVLKHKKCQKKRFLKKKKKMMGIAKY
jgi:hypothetical protein